MLDFADQPRLGFLLCSSPSSKENCERRVLRVGVPAFSVAFVSDRVFLPHNLQIYTDFCAVQQIFAKNMRPSENKTCILLQDVRRLVFQMTKGTI